MQPESMTSLDLVVEIVGATVADWDLDIDGDLGPETRLSLDLCFSSVEMMHLLASIDMRLGRKLPYDRLIKRNGVFRNELTIGELAGFVADQSEDAPAPSVARPA